MTPNLDELREEYRREVIGELIFALLEREVGYLTARYDPAIYSPTQEWGDGRAEILQSFVAEVLVHDGQLDYLFQVSADHDHFVRLLRRQLRLFVGRKRARTVIDNLLDRARQIAKTAPQFEIVSSDPWAYKPAGTAVSSSDESLGEKLRELSTKASALARPARNSAAERASKVLTEKDLSYLMLQVAEKLDCAVTVGMLDQCFRSAFTDYVVSFLTDTDSVYVMETAPEQSASPEDRLLIKDLAVSISDSLSDDDRLLLVLKAADESDLTVAERLGVSRPTLANRKHELYQRLRAQVACLPEPQRTTVIDIVLAELQVQS